MKSIILDSIFIVFLIVSCATPRYGSRIEILGDNFEKAEIINEKINDIPDIDAKKVKLYFGKLPKGIINSNGTLSVGKGYKHKIIGKISTTGQVANWFAKMYNDDENWRNYYCPPVKVLTVATLFLLPLTGIPAPCYTGNNSNDNEDISIRKKQLIYSLKRAALAAGGNAVYLDEIGKTTTFNKQTKVKISDKEMTSAAGWALKLKYKKNY